MMTLAEWAWPLLDTAWPPGAPITHDQPIPSDIEALGIARALMEFHLPGEVHTFALQVQIAAVVEEWRLLREAQ